MSKKNLYLGGAFVVLVLAAYVFNGPWQEWREKSVRSKNFLAKIDMSRVDFIDIVYDGKEVGLEKISERWRVSGTKDFYLEESLAERLDSVLQEAKIAEVELISENQDRKEEFGLNEEEAAKIKLRQGENEAVEFFVGMPGNDFGSAYVSQSGSELSYLLKAPLSDLFLRAEWHDRRIFSSDSEKVGKIRFQYPNREFSVEKNENGWLGTEPYRFNVSEEKIEKILALMTNLSAAKIPEQKFEGTDLEKNLIIIEVSGEDVNNVLMIGGPESEDEQLYFAKKGDSDNIYLIEKDLRDSLDVTIGGLR